MNIRAAFLRVLAFAAAIAMAFLPVRASAGDIVDSAAEAERLLAASEPVEALAAAEAAYDATWRAIPLSFRKALFVDGKPAGFGRYTPRQSATFKAGDEIVVYAEPVGYAYGVKGGDGAENGGKDEGDESFTIDLDADLEVRTGGGQILASSEGFSRLSQTAAIRERAFNVTLEFAFTGLKPGDYVLAVTLRDVHSDKKGTFELPFVMDAPKPQSRPAEE